MRFFDLTPQDSCEVESYLRAVPKAVTIMGIESIAAVSAIIVAIFLAIIVLVWQGNRSDARFDRVDARFDALSAEFRSLRESLEPRLELDSRLRSVEREQAEARGSARRQRESEGTAD